MNISDVLELLKDAFMAPKRLPHCVEELQQLVWTEKVDGSPEELDVLRDLAYDLDYFEADAARRGEDPSFVDEERACQEIRLALQKLAGKQQLEGYGELARPT